MTRFKLFIIALFMIPALGLGVSKTVTPAVAAITVTPSTCSNCPGGSPQCVTFNFSKISTAAIQQAFQEVLQSFLDSFLGFFDDIFNNFLGGLLQGFQDIFEMQFIQWQDAFFAYDWIPNLQRQTSQVYTMMVNSSQAINSGLDSQTQAKVQRAVEGIEADAFISHRPSGGLCVAGSIGGSNLGRTYNFARMLRDAWERKFSHRGMGANSEFTMASLGLDARPQQSFAENQGGVSRLTPGLKGLEGSAFEKYVQDAQMSSSWKAGPIGHMGYQWARYCQFLADPNDNGGNTGCPEIQSPENSRGMDVNPTKYLFNTLVLDLDDPAVKHGAEAMIENLTSLSPPQIVPPNTSDFRQEILDQRVFLARQNAARSVVDYIKSTRMPVQGAHELVKELRENARIPLSEINPDKTSYKEIMHAMSTEKFASGEYNLDKVGDIANAKREAVVLSAFYLMQLRDYYELMERGLLTLAIQTAMEVDSTASGTFGDNNTSVTNAEGSE